MKSLLWIDGRLPGLNEIIDARSRGRKGIMYTRMKRKCTEAISRAAAVQKVKRFESVWLTYVHVEKDRRRDPSNFCGGAAKFIEDGLVQAKVIPNDGWKNINGFAHCWTTSSHDGTLVVISDEELMPIEDAMAVYKSLENPA